MKPVLDSERALWRKLEREAYRAFHAKTKNHKADHFFNFCVTAHAMRDFFLEAQGVSQGKARGAFHATWDAEPVLVAVKEIANLSKHFELRHARSGKPRTPQTRRLVQRRGQAFDVYVTAKGNIKTIPRPAPEISVTTSDGARYDLWVFGIQTVFVRR